MATVAAIGLLYLRAGRGTILLLLVLTIAGAISPAASSLLTREVINGAVGGEFVGSAVAGLAAVGVLAGAMPAATGYFLEELDRRVNELCVSRLYRAINGFDGIGRFEDPEYLDRIRMAETAAGPAVNRTIMGVFGLIRSLVTLVSLTGALLTVNGALAALVLIAGVPGLGAEMWLSDKRLEIMHRLASVERRKQFFASVLTDVQAAKEVRAFGVGHYLHDRMLSDVRRVHRAERALGLRMFHTQSLLEGLGAAVAGVGLVWGASRAASGTLTVGDMSAFLVAVVGAQAAVRGLVDGVVEGRQALKMYDYFAAVADEGSDLPVAARFDDCPALRRDIELRDVWFRYTDDGPWVLRGLSLTLPRGRTIGLVGTNGAGKSTLIKLLCRFYDPSCGSIRWDGLDLRDLPIESLRQRLSVVFQDYMAWDLTVRENIGLGDVDYIADSDRIMEAARLTGLDAALARLPQGYDTVLGRKFGFDGMPTGSRQTAELSGGQWQRLAIARSVFRGGRDLIIFDEPSASLDPVAEHQIYEVLRSQSRDVTRLIISHRLSTIRDADLIVVLDGGVVAEIGSHDELLALNGHYSRLFHLQLRGQRGPSGREAHRMKAV